MTRLMILMCMSKGGRDSENVFRTISKYMSVGIILLAAGSSSRMGQSKQLLPIAGEPLLLKTVMTAIRSQADNVVVVLGANEAAHRKLIQELPIDIITNPNWQRGIGSSLKKGLEKILLPGPHLEAIIVMVCDQPLLTIDHLNKLVQKFKNSKSKIVASYYSGMAGVPALFDKSLFNELLKIEDDSGAKQIIQHRKDLVQHVAFPQGSVDLDTPEEYQAFISQP
jgi:molybdenum cofactor cytidylyltransferase